MRKGLKFYFILPLFIQLFACSPKPNTSKVILVAAINSGPGAAILTFREDSTFEWISGIGGSPEDGKYYLKDSLIYLEGVKLEGALRSNHFLMTRNNPNNKNLKDLILLQIDNKRKVIDSHLIFRVTFKNRKIKP